MEDCGAVYYDRDSNQKDPYRIFGQAGATLVRLRLWHSPTWTNYSDFEDDKKINTTGKGGEGLVYWEPAWVSTGCYTLRGQGSHWGNATLFDHNNRATRGMQFYNATLPD